MIIPAFNEAEILPGTLRKVSSFLESMDFKAEVIVVDNGSTDQTSDVIHSFQEQCSDIHYMRVDTAGKGGAVRAGIMAARGEYLLISDADLAVPIEYTIRFLPPGLKDFDIAIGSREADGAIRYGEPFKRHLMGRAFNFMVRVLLLPGFQDTQCGFKCFRREVARELFALSRVDGWGFDVEILYRGRLKGYRIIEVPVEWHYGEGSKIRPVWDSLAMFRELLSIRRRGK
ncbi:MAG: glycosyltransferase family 2 protein [Proteobacteria bacterium]|nr:glycosyltransferase family 2 protein [Pseudomonadota bacterium]MBU1688993.1 glycosyltransferase family 2 protein [Pseudomonadota bacterium]